jgi:hypothetical protein
MKILSARPSKRALVALAALAAPMALAAPVAYLAISATPDLDGELAESLLDAWANRDQDIG